MEECTCICESSFGVAAQIDGKGYCARLPSPVEFEQRYEIEGVLGQGTSGKVYLAWDNQAGRSVALKVLKRGLEASSELSSLRLLNGVDVHANYFVKLLHSGEWKGRTCLVFEYLAKNLYEVLAETNFCGLPLANVKVFAWQVLTAVSVLEEVHLVHRDLKPENIMLATVGKAGVKLIDFSSACEARQAIQGPSQSRYYRAPEVLKGHNYSYPVDLWSVGCILAELHTGRPLFPGKNSQMQLEKIWRFREKGGAAQFIKKHSVWAEDDLLLTWFIELLDGLLQENPQERLKADQALAHPFFTGDKVHSRKSSFGSPVSKLSTNTSSPPSRLNSCEFEPEPTADVFLFN